MPCFEGQPRQAALIATEWASKWASKVVFGIRVMIWSTVQILEGQTLSMEPAIGLEPMTC